MKVTYIGHSGFAVEFETCALIFDYYKGRLPRFEKEKKIYVFASHSHHDHFQADIFEWEKEYRQIQYILSDDIDAEKEPNRIFTAPDREYAVDHIRIKTLRSTDEGVAFFVSVPEGGPDDRKTVYHGGDLNWWHWEEEGESYNRRMERDYKKALKPLEGVRVNVAFVPVDPRLGDAYFWGLDWFMRHTDTEKVYPMHMWGKYKTLDRLIKEPATKPYRGKIIKLGEEEECR